MTENITLSETFVHQQVEITSIDIKEPFLPSPEDLPLSERKRRRLPSPVSIVEPVIAEPVTFDPFEGTADDDVLSDDSSSSFSSSSETASNSSQSTSSSSNSSFFSEESSVSDSFPAPDFSLEDPDFSMEDSSGHLYSGSPLSTLSVLAILFSWFSAFPGISKQALSQLLYILHHFILPSGNSLPDTYAKAYSLIQQLLVPVQEYHCCPNDCILFRGPHADKTECPICGSRRFTEGKIPKKRFKYLPLASRVQRFFQSSRISKLLQSHALVVPSDDVHDIHQTSTWKEWYSENGIFKGDCRGLSLGLCIDGTNPFSKEKNSYSMWPIILSFLNLPSSLRRTAGFLQLVGIIPGKNEPKNIDPYLDVLIDEIKSLNSKQIYDAHQQNWFSLQVELLLHVADYPGQNKLFHCHGAGAYSGCCYCTIKGEYSKSLSKVVYLDHRRFLPLDDTLRLEKTGFPSSKRPRASPAVKDMGFVDKANKQVDETTSRKKKKQLARISGCKGSYSLRQLSNHDRYLNTPVEPMHLLKNIVEHIVRLLSGSSDSSKLRMEEKFRGRFSSIWVMNKASSKLPPAPFRLSTNEAKIANVRCLSIQVPIGFGWKPQAIFTSNIGMKSHSWKQLVAFPILKYCLRGLLGQEQRKTLFLFCSVLARLCSESININLIEKLEFDVHYCLSLMEKDFPVALHVCVFHLLHHLPFYLRRFGPSCVFWMYPFERFNSWLIRRVQNRRYPESTVAETYRLFEWVHFLLWSQELPSKAITFPDEDTSSYWENNATSSELSPLQFASLESMYSPDIRSQLKRGVLKMDRYVYCDEHGRKVTFTSMDSDSRLSVSSYVYSRSFTESLTLGRIQFFFRHCLESHTYAYVHWFGIPSKEVESELSFVFVDSVSSFSPIIPVQNLCGPVVTAVDTDQHNKLWILI